MNTLFDLPKTTTSANCKIVYAPSGQALEYSALATNPYHTSDISLTLKVIETLQELRIQQHN